MQSIGRLRQENFSGSAVLFRLFHAPRRGTVSSRFWSADLAARILLCQGDAVSLQPSTNSDL